MSMENKTSQHILGTAANLLGFCLFILTSLHLTNMAENAMVDEFTSVVAFLLVISSFLSFLSIRSKSEVRTEKLERYAEYFFVASLLGIFFIIVFLLANYW